MEIKYLKTFLNFLIYEKGFSRLTCSAYKKDLEQFFAYVKKYPEDIKKRDVDDFSEHLRKAEQEYSTISRKLAAIKAFYKFLVQDDIIPDSPVEDIDLPKLAKILPKSLTKIEIKKFILSIEPIEPEDHRDKALLELLYASGMRISELINLKMEDVALTDRIIKVLGKGSKERLVPIGRQAKDSLHRYLIEYRNSYLQKKNKESDFFFISHNCLPLTRQFVWQIVKKRIAQTSIIKNVSPHTMRHTFATHLIENGADLRTVQEILGHANIATTQIYTAVSKEHLKKVYGAAHPRA